MELAARQEQVLGTIVEAKLPARNAPLLADCFAEARRIESQYSRFIATSELSRLNANAGSGAWQDCSQEMAMLLTRAEEFRRQTNGAFDVTVKSDLDRMGYDKDYSFKPKENGEAKANSGLAGYEVDGNRVLLHREVDFGGFGKGYCLDRIAGLLEERGVSHYYVNAGGDIIAKKGEESGCEPWTILLEHPDDPSLAIGTIELDGRAIAASAPNRRKWGPKGEFHHLVNAATGMPAQGAKAIFVVAGTGTEADAYSTAIFTSGFEGGIELSRQLPVEMLFVSSENKMYQTAGFKAALFA